MSQQPPDYERWATLYRDTKRLATASEEERERLRLQILEMLQGSGTPDEEGHLYLPAGKYTIKGELRRTVKFNREAAQKWLEENGWWDDAKVEVPERIVVEPAYDKLDEEDLHAFLFASRFDPSVPDSPPDDIYDITDNFALKVLDEKPHDY